MGRHPSTFSQGGANIVKYRTIALAAIKDRLKLGAPGTSLLSEAAIWLGAQIESGMVDIMILPEHTNGITTAQGAVTPTTPVRRRFRPTTCELTVEIVSPIACAVLR